MSGGRVELGIGTGWYDGEHSAYGIPFPPLGERFERLEEQLEIITGLWATPDGETFSFDGRHYHAAPTRPALPKPVQQPRPPIIIGGGGQADAAAWRRGSPTSSTCRSVGRRHPPRAVDRVRAACEAAGRDPDDR